MPLNCKGAETRRSILFVLSNSINSRKSLLSCIAEIPFLELQKDCDSLFRGSATVFGHVRRICLGEAPEDANHFFHFLLLYRD